MSGELAVASRLAIAAGRAAMAHYGGVTARMKDAGSPVTAADMAANAVISEGLAREFPKDPVLSEESPDTDGRMGSARVWIVDPLDGTKEFLAMNGEFAVMIGLALDGAAAVGAVYLPATDVLLSGIVGLGAWIAQGGARSAIECRAAERPAPRLIGSRSHADPFMDRIQEAVGAAEFQICGSVGVKAARVIQDHSDLYAHPVPYLKEWDTCAPEAVVRGAGGQVSDCLGQPLTYNKREPVQPHGILVRAPGCDAAAARIRALYEARVDG